LFHKLSTRFAARYVARTASNELERRYQLVEQVASSDRFREALKAAMANPEFRNITAQLSDPQLSDEQQQLLLEEFRDNPDREKLQRTFASLIPPTMRPREEEEVASWFFCDAQGLSTVRVPESRTIGKNFAWRSYFYGGSRDMEETWRPEPGQHIAGTTLSAVFRSQATSRWIVAISTPMFDDSPENKFLGIVAMTVEVGRFIELRGGNQLFAVSVDLRDGDYPGVILQHPLFDKLLDTQGEIPERFKNYRVRAADLPDVPERQQNYIDPLASDPEGGAYQRHWLAQMEPVMIRGENTGWIVIVQTAYYPFIGYTLEDLSSGLIRYGLIAIFMIALVMMALWVWASSMIRKPVNSVSGQ